MQQSHAQTHGSHALDIRTSVELTCSAFCNAACAKVRSRCAAQHCMHDHFSRLLSQGPACLPDSSSPPPVLLEDDDGSHPACCGSCARCLALAQLGAPPEADALQPAAHIALHGGGSPVRPVLQEQPAQAACTVRL